MKILLIEDSRFLRLVIEKALAKGGHDVTGVADGQEGLRAARATPPQLILLDMMLPGLDGTGVLKKLKLDPLTAQIPVVVLTALSQRNETKLKEAGAAGYLEKSSLNLANNPSVLIRIVESVLEKSSEAHGSGPPLDKLLNPQVCG
jgi:CheY-like chemotaxis protein